MVYASHGLGRVVRIDRPAVRGASEDVVVVELSDGLTVSLPQKLAEAQLRAPLTSDQLRLVQEVLRQEPVGNDKPWLSRRHDAAGKLTNGGVVELAEIVRDGTVPARAHSTKGNTSEREVLLKARRLLSREISFVLGLGATEADDWIDEQLGR